MTTILILLKVTLLCLASQVRAHQDIGLMGVNELARRAGHRKARQLGTELMSTDLNAGICASAIDEGCQGQVSQGTFVLIAADKEAPMRPLF